MKKILLALFAIIQLQSFATMVIPSGSTIYMGDENVTENILIQPDAELVIVGDVKMGNPANPDQKLYILIQDGGKLKSFGGSITGRSIPGGGIIPWQGIVVEATTYPVTTTGLALDLDYITIKDADIAIDLTAYYSYAYGVGALFLVNRSIIVKNAVFEDNVRIFNGTYHSLLTPSGVG